MIDWRQYFTSDPQVCHGQLCAKGTRVFVTNILDSLAEGATHDTILKSSPKSNSSIGEGFEAFLA